MGLCEQKWRRGRGREGPARWVEKERKMMKKLGFGEIFRESEDDSPYYVCGPVMPCNLGYVAHFRPHIMGVISSSLNL